MARSLVTRMTTLNGSPVSSWRRKNYVHAKYIDIEKKCFFSGSLSTNYVIVFATSDQAL